MADGGGVRSQRGGQVKRVAIVQRDVGLVPSYPCGDRPGIHSTVPTKLRRSASTRMPDG